MTDNVWHSDSANFKYDPDNTQPLLALRALMDSIHYGGGKLDMYHETYRDITAEENRENLIKAFGLVNVALLLPQEFARDEHLKQKRAQSPKI